MKKRLFLIKYWETYDHSPHMSMQVEERYVLDFSLESLEAGLIMDYYDPKKKVRTTVSCTELPFTDNTFGS